MVPVGRGPRSGRASRRAEAARAHPGGDHRIRTGGPAARASAPSRRHRHRASSSAGAGTTSCPGSGPGCWSRARSTSCATRAWRTASTPRASCMAVRALVRRRPAPGRPRGPDGRAQGDGLRPDGGHPGPHAGPRGGGGAAIYEAHDVGIADFDTPLRGCAVAVRAAHEVACDFVAGCDGFHGVVGRAFPRGRCPRTSGSTRSAGSGSCPTRRRSRTS